MIASTFNKKFNGILFDARHIENNYSGLGRYTFSILKGLINTTNKLIVIILNRDIDDNNEFFKYIKYSASNNKNITIFYTFIKPFGFLHHFLLPLSLRRFKGYLYFYPHFDLPLLFFSDTIFVVHDLLPIKVENYIQKYRSLKILFFKFFIKFGVFKKNSRVVTVSESTRNDVVNYFANADKIYVSYLSNFEQIRSHTATKIINDNYLLYVGDWRPHKNIKLLIDLFKGLKNNGYEGKLVIAGSQRIFDFDVFSYVKNNNDIILTGNISDTQLDNLYYNMDAFIFLSKYEGFGLPVVEAGKYGKKVICFSSSSLPEVAPPWSLSLDLNVSLDEMIIKVKDYIQFDKFIYRNICGYSKRFCWDKSATKIFN